MSLFAKAAEKSTKTAKKAKSKGRVWQAGDPAGDEIGKAVHELVVLSAEEKAIKAKKSLFAVQVANYAQNNLIEDYADTGVFPETPMQVMNNDGEKVTYVVQDRSSQYKVKPEQKEALVQLLGEDAVPDLLYTEVSLQLNREVMAKPGVSEAIEKALVAAIKRLTKSGVLDEDDELIEADVKETFKPGTLSRLGIICGRDTGKMMTFLKAMGSCCVRSIKC